MFHFPFRIRLSLCLCMHKLLLPSNRIKILYILVLAAYFVASSEIYRYVFSWIINNTFTVYFNKFIEREASSLGLFKTSGIVNIFGNNFWLGYYHIFICLYVCDRQSNGFSSAIQYSESRDRTAVISTCYGTFQLPAFIRFRISVLFVGGKNEVKPNAIFSAGLSNEYTYK
jgi:hypothetical protein